MGKWIREWVCDWVNEWMSESVRVTASEPSFMARTIICSAYSAASGCRRPILPQTVTGPLYSQRESGLTYCFIHFGRSTSVISRSDLNHLTSEILASDSSTLGDGGWRWGGVGGRPVGSTDTVSWTSWPALRCSWPDQAHHLGASHQPTILKCDNSS